MALGVRLAEERLDRRDRTPAAGSNGRRPSVSTRTSRAESRRIGARERRRDRTAQRVADQYRWQSRMSRRSTRRATNRPVRRRWRRPRRTRRLAGEVGGDDAVSRGQLGKHLHPVPRRSHRGRAATRSAGPRLPPAPRSTRQPRSSRRSVTGMPASSRRRMLGRDRSACSCSSLVARRVRHTSNVRSARTAARIGQIMQIGRRSACASSCIAVATVPIRRGRVRRRTPWRRTATRCRA